MSGSSSDSPLASLWTVHRGGVLALGHELHQCLSATDESITLHGRDLRPDDEGTGFQFQYLLSPGANAPAIRAAYFVAQFQLVRRTTSVAWQIDALPVIDCDGVAYRLFERQTLRVSLPDRAALRAAVLDRLAPQAAAFFSSVRAGAPFAGAFTEITAAAQAAIASAR